MSGEYDPMTTGPAKPPYIKTIDDLRDHLQAAVELEHSTIPPYLCGLYTIRNGRNPEASAIIRTVVVQEMLHMILAANVLNAVGGAPSIAYPDFVPAYPAQLPIGVDEPLTVNLLKFSPEALDTFLKIEKPAPVPHLETPMMKAAAPVPVPPGQLRKMIREGTLYRSIGDFYAAIEIGLKALEAEAAQTGGTIFTGDPARQISRDYYYNSGGEVVRVGDLPSALEALEVIVDQGEGFESGIGDGDRHYFDQPGEVAHYYRFEEIRLGRYYQPGDTPDSGPTGASFTVDYGPDAVFDMIDNPTIALFGTGEVADRALACAQSYTALLGDLEQGLNGAPQSLVAAVVQMFTLKEAALDLLQNPAPGHEPRRAGPCFEYRLESAS